MNKQFFYVSTQINTFDVFLLTMSFCFHSGITGWYPVYVPTLGWDTNPQDDPTSHNPDSPRTAAGLHRVVGGLELSIKFAHADDLTRVIGAAKGVGWEPDFDTDSIDWENGG